MFLLDTNVISEYRKIKSGRADPNVAAWAIQVRSHVLLLSVISILELKMGVLTLARKDQQQSKILQKWLEEAVLPAFKGRIIPVDVRVAKICARLQVPDPKSERDALIAATALAAEMTLVTRNTSDFEKTGATLLNPWLASHSKS